MSSPSLVNVLDSYLRSREKGKEALRSLLLSGRISQKTFDFMEKQVSHVVSMVSELKETLGAEASFSKANISEDTMILESLLVELRFRHVLGKIGEDEWTQKSETLSLALDSLKTSGTSESKIEQEPAHSIQTTLEEHTTKTETERDLSQALGKSKNDVKSMEESPVGNGHSSGKQKRRVTKEPPDLGSHLASRIHCMNPWNPECKDTDIELSIYYNGRMTPICRRCWEDISKRNIEWSSL